MKSGGNASYEWAILWRKLVQENWSFYPKVFSGSTNCRLPNSFQNLQYPSIFMPFIDNFICFCGDGMIESMLEPHMKDEAGSSQIDVGVAFLILGGLYMSWCQCYKPFYRSNLPPFHFNAVILCYKPWKLPRMAVHFCGILTLEKVGLKLPW